MNFKKSELKTFGEFKVIKYKAGEFEVSASSQGIGLNGPVLISEQDDLEKLAEVIAKAWQLYQSMRRENGISMEQDNQG